MHTLEAANRVTESWFTQRDHVDHHALEVIQPVLLDTAVDAAAGHAKSKGSKNRMLPSTDSTTSAK